MAGSGTMICTKTPPKITPLLAFKRHVPLYGVVLDAAGAVKFTETSSVALGVVTLIATPAGPIKKAIIAQAEKL